MVRILSFRDFLHYAERLYNDAVGKGEGPSSYPYVIGSILASWMAIESFINNMMQDFASLPEGTLTIHERGFLEEKQVVFAREGLHAGSFCLENKEQFWRLEDKILFLIAKFGTGKKVDRGTHIWQRFNNVKNKRNALTHPKRNREIELTLADAQEAMNVAKILIDLLSMEVRKERVNW